MTEHLPAGGSPSSLAGRIQRRLERLYHLEQLPAVDDFSSCCGPGEREQVLVREQQGEIELAVRLPPEGLAPAGPPVALDVLCQVIEGVSHFLLLAYRAACDLPSTLLELELQAEVDKFALLALGPLLKAERGTVRELHARLYERACFAHDEATEEGQRYRLASDLAARFWARLGARMPGEQATLRRLRAFHRAGQADKIRLALAA